jgi:hypothetical protein
MLHLWPHGGQNQPSTVPPARLRGSGEATFSSAIRRAYMTHAAKGCRTCSKGCRTVLALRISNMYQQSSVGRLLTSAYLLGCEEVRPAQ